MTYMLKVDHAECCVPLQSDTLDAINCNNVTC